MTQETTEAHKRYIVEEMALVNKINGADVFEWLAKGWVDTKRTWRVSVTYATLFLMLGLFVSFGFHLLGLPYLILPSLTGFLLIGPAVAIGFYEGSRRIQAGESFSLSDAIFAFRRNTWSIMAMGIAQVFFFMIWIRLSFTLFAIAFPGIMPEWDVILTRALSMEGVHFAVMVTGLGSIFAGITFFTGAFSLPLMVDRKTVLIPALITSAFAVQQNLKPMVLWAGLIAGLMFLGLITGIGLIIIFPLIGHATWHAYQRVLGSQTD